jgi:hypothetical protein
MHLALSKVSAGTAVLAGCLAFASPVRAQPPADVADILTEAVIEACLETGALVPEDVQAMSDEELSRALADCVKDLKTRPRVAASGTTVVTERVVPPAIVVESTPIVVRKVRERAARRVIVRQASPDVIIQGGGGGRSTAIALDNLAAAIENLNASRQGNGGDVVMVPDATVPDVTVPGGVGPGGPGPGVPGPGMTAPGTITVPDVSVPGTTPGGTVVPGPLVVDPSRQIPIGPDNGPLVVPGTGPAGGATLPTEAGIGQQFLGLKSAISQGVKSGALSSAELAELNGKLREFEQGAITISRPTDAQLRTQQDQLDQVNALLNDKVRNSDGIANPGLTVQSASQRLLPAAGSLATGPGVGAAGAGGMAGGKPSGPGGTPVTNLPVTDSSLPAGSQGVASVDAKAKGKGKNARLTAMRERLAAKAGQPGMGTPKSRFAAARERLANKAAGGGGKRLAGTGGLVNQAGTQTKGQKSRIAALRQKFATQGTGAGLTPRVKGTGKPHIKRIATVKKMRQQSAKGTAKRQGNLRRMANVQRQVAKHRVAKRQVLRQRGQAFNKMRMIKQQHAAVRQPARMQNGGKKQRQGQR